MQGLDELVLLESDGVLGKYLCTKTNEIVEGVGTIAVPRGDKIEKYRGMVIWSSEQPITIQVNSAKRICSKYCDISDKDLLNMAREKMNWTFGEFFGVDAVNIIEQSKKYNLKIEMVDIDSGELL